MKNILLSGLAFLLLLPAYSQTDQGSWLVGGSAGLDYTVQTSSKAFNASLSPQTGYFVVDNFAIGLRLPLGLQIVHTETSNFSGGEITDRTITYRVGLGPFARYYFSKSAIRPFVNAGADYQYSRTNRKINESETSQKEDSYSIFGGAGIAYFISNFVGLETQLGYTYYRSDELNKYSRLGLNVGLQIYIPQK